MKCICSYIHPVISSFVPLKTTYLVHSTYTNNCNNNVQFLNKNILDFRLFKSQLACFKFYLRDAEDDLEKLGAGTEEKSAELYFSLFTHCVETGWCEV